ncbi:hypothetical protein Val02_12480 [Virgisporangium aliadipatigenens]|uniref:Phage shock protein PspC N-terminal domain-containing protein n=1 Tax=Virgisporangium aliadipatigenens TaxID=741659 RepID=A0A8J3YHH6_9ACTN|nr:PspC domain-containing protein [Virgisporangium aliadipatigenens]GIJ44362.1 hypothetical protein Val02_12480 [Virgisporangium aliadipatigenens]
MKPIHDEFRRLGLTRPAEGGVLGGVFAGLGRRVGLDPWPARIAGTALLWVLPGSQVLLYPALWVLMPSDAPEHAPTTPVEDPAVKAA